MGLKSQIIINHMHFWQISVNRESQFQEQKNLFTLFVKYFHEKTPISGVDYGVESGVSRVNFIRLTRSESSRKCPTHFEHYSTVFPFLSMHKSLLSWEKVRNW